MDKPPHAAGRRRDGLVNLGQPTNPQNSAYVLFAVLPPKNSNSTGAKALSAQGFPIAKPHFRPTMRRESLWPQEKFRSFNHDAGTTSPRKD
jgi:hypothetical protein